MRRRSQVVGQASLAESLSQLAQPVVEGGSGNAHLPGDFGHGAVVQAHAQIPELLPGSEAMARSRSMRISWARRSLISRVPLPREPSLLQEVDPLGGVAFAVVEGFIE